jgi:hypothetical protein
VDGEGKRYTSAGAGATRFEVEEAGPVRTVARAEGPFAGPDGQFLKYRCRMYFYRGFAGIPTEVSLLAHEGKSGFPPTLNACPQPDVADGVADGRGRSADALGAG